MIIHAKEKKVTKITHTPRHDYWMLNKRNYMNAML